MHALPLRHRPARSLDRPTRGKTAPGRLRPVDALFALWDPGVLTRRDGPWRDAWWVDLGFGAEPDTTLESARRLRRINPGLRVLGVERDRDRAMAALPHAAALTAFRHGGFDLPLAPHESVRAVRAMNVLRQYEPDAAEAALDALAGQLLPGGLLIEGTSDPAGRLWTANVIRRPEHHLTVPSGSQPPARTEAVVLGVRGSGPFEPADLRAVLPKRYIHRLTPGEPVHALFDAWTAAWQATRAEAVWGRARQLAAAADALRAAGFPVDARRRWTQRGMLVWRPEARP